MRHSLINLLFAAVYVIVLLLGLFVIDILIASVILAIVLTVNIIYSSYFISGRSEEMGEEFVERERLKEERSRRRAIIDRITVMIDLAVIKIYNLRVYIRGIVYVLE